MAKSSEQGILVKVRNSTYEADVYAFVGEEDDFLSLLCGRFKVDESEVCRLFENTLLLDGYAVHFANDLLFVYLPDFQPDSFRSIKILSHEALHIACFILASRGVRVDIAVNTECLNYLHDEVFEKLYVALSRKRRKS